MEWSVDFDISRDLGSWNTQPMLIDRFLNVCSLGFPPWSLDLARFLELTMVRSCHLAQRVCTLRITKSTRVPGVWLLRNLCRMAQRQVRLSIPSLAAFAHLFEMTYAGNSVKCSSLIGHNIWTHGTPADSKCMQLQVRLSGGFKLCCTVYVIPPSKNLDISYVYIPFPAIAKVVYSEAIFSISSTIHWSTFVVNIFLQRDPLLGPIE